jgi:predicted nucleic acid-binding protein
LKTFLDSGVLLAGWRRTSVTDAALSVLADETREFYTAQLVRLETLPKARHEKNRREQEFYETHFASTVHCEPLSAELGNEAEALAVHYGLAGPDALQMAAAIRQGVKEFITSEKPGKPMFRVKELKVVSLFSLT